MSSGSSCSGTEACRQPCPRDERHPDRSADSQSAQSDPARPSTTGLPQARHPPSPRPGAKAQQQPHKAAPQHRQGEPKGRSDRPLRPAPIPGTPLRVAPDPKAQSRQAKSQTPLCPSHAALEARPNSLISQRSSQYEPFFKSDLVAIEEAPDHGRGEALAAIGDQSLLDFQERHVRLTANETKQIIAMGLDAMGTAIPAN